MSVCYEWNSGRLDRGRTLQAGFNDVERMDGKGRDNPSSEASYRLNE